MGLSRHTAGTLVRIDYQVRDTFQKALSDGPLTPTALIARVRELDGRVREPSDDLAERDLVWDLIDDETLQINADGLLEWDPPPSHSRS